MELVEVGIVGVYVCVRVEMMRRDEARVESIES